MDALLGDLLTFSRMSQQRLELVPVELEMVVRSVLARLENEIKEKHAQVVSATARPRVLAHESVLDQVISNLLDNALKFVAPGEPPRIRLHTEDRGPVRAGLGRGQRHCHRARAPGAGLSSVHTFERRALWWHGHPGWPSSGTIIEHLGGQGRRRVRARTRQPLLV